MDGGADPVRATSRGKGMAEADVKAVQSNPR